MIRWSATADRVQLSWDSRASLEDTTVRSSENIAGTEREGRNPLWGYTERVVPPPRRSLVLVTVLPGLVTNALYQGGQLPPFPPTIVPRTSTLGLDFYPRFRTRNRVVDGLRRQRDTDASSANL